MIVSFIAAVSENNAIGRQGGLPWNLPEDLKFFKQKTVGKPVIMGRKTYESLGRPLPGRVNIVLSGDNSYVLPHGVLKFNDIQSAIDWLQGEATEEAFIIGGGVIFAASMHLADRMYITRIHTIIADADAFFPEIDHTHWRLVWEEKHMADARHAFAFSFQQFERIEM